MDGVIVVDKPEGLTSHRVVEVVRERLSGRVRVGHLGTLDPIATGVLPICLGRATKLSAFLMGGKKEYLATIRLGEETDTLDREGNILFRADVDEAVEERIGKVLESFVGEIEQVPPAFSAIKRSGLPLHRLARRGILVEPEPRKVWIYDMELVDMDLPFITIRVVTSPGTYIRSLCRDIGRALGCYGHMHRLRRLRSGDFTLHRALSFDALKGMDPEGLKRYLIPLEGLLPHLRRVEVDGFWEERIRNGVQPALPLSGIPVGEVVRFFSKRGRFLAIGRATGAGGGKTFFRLIRVLA